MIFRSPGVEKTRKNFIYEHYTLARNILGVFTVWIGLETDEILAQICGMNVLPMMIAKIVTELWNVLCRSSINVSSHPRAILEANLMLNKFILPWTLGLLLILSS